MTSATAAVSTLPPPPRAKTSTPKAEVREAVRNLLMASKAFGQLPAATQRQIAHDTTMIADYLVAPEGFPGQHLPKGIGVARALDDPAAPAPPPQASYGEARQAVDAIGKEDFKAGAAQAGAAVAGQILQKVNFTSFVAGLIKGVFHSIVQSSMEQMEAYAKLVANVSKSLNDFRDENVTENQGRDHLTEQFPDLFQIGKDDFGDDPGPKIQLKDGVDEDAALARVNQSMQFPGGPLKSMDLSDPETEAKLVMGARTQLATGRQQLLATLVMMGINRIVVTDGRISAKILYDFTAKDTRKLERSATAADYARDTSGNLALTRDSEGEYDYGSQSKTSGGDDQSSDDSDRDASWYTKGKYKYSEKPVMTAMSTASDMQDSSLTAKASLAGNVEVNFKSDYLPLDKMATPGMIAAIQMNSRPVDPNSANFAPGGPPPAGGSQTAPGAAAPPAGQAQPPRGA